MYIERIYNHEANVMNQIIKYGVGLAISICLISPAMAKGNGHSNGNHSNHSEHVENSKSSYKHDNRSSNNGRYQGSSGNPGLALGHYKKGDKLPSSYLNDRYYVTDWKAHNLKRPPRGYRWIYADGRYILASIITGVITDILLGDYYR